MNTLYRHFPELRRRHVGKSRLERVADRACTVVLILAAAYFVGITAHAWWLGRFSEAAIKAVGR